MILPTSNGEAEVSDTYSTRICASHQYVFSQQRAKKFFLEAKYLVMLPKFLTFLKIKVDFLAPKKSHTLFTALAHLFRVHSTWSHENKDSRQRSKEINFDARRSVYPLCQVHHPLECRKLKVLWSTCALAHLFSSICRTTNPTHTLIPSLSCEYRLHHCNVRMDSIFRKWTLARHEQIRIFFDVTGSLKIDIFTHLLVEQCDVLKLFRVLYGIFARQKATWFPFTRNCDNAQCTHSLTVMD